jgi:hypothetical protein
LAVVALGLSGDAFSFTLAGRCSAEAAALGLGVSCATVGAVVAAGAAITLGSTFAGAGLGLLALLALGAADGRGSGCSGIGAGARRAARSALGAGLGAGLDAAALGFAGALASGDALANFRTGRDSAGGVSATTGAVSSAAFVLATCVAGALWAGLTASVKWLSTTAPPMTDAAIAPMAIPK